MGYETFEQLCKEKGITPYFVAKETGVSTSTLSSWKTGRYQPKTAKLQLIADYFDIPLAYLLSGDESLNKPISHTTEEYDKSESILKMYGIDVSKSTDEVALNSGGIIYTVTANSYEVFCDDVTKFLDKAVDKLLHGNIISITFKSVDGAVPQAKIQSIAEMLKGDTLQAAHADNSATKEQLEKDISLLKEKGDEKGDNV